MLLHALNHQLNQEVEQVLVFQDDFKDFMTWRKNKRWLENSTSKYFVFVSCFEFFRVCFVFWLGFIVFVSIYTKHKTRNTSFRVSCSQLWSRRYACVMPSEFLHSPWRQWRFGVNTLCAGRRGSRICRPSPSRHWCRNRTLASTFACCVRFNVRIYLPFLARQSCWFTFALPLLLKFAIFVKF